MGTFTACIFDLDGVLLDSENINIRAIIETMASAGHPLTREEMEAISGRSSSDFIPEMLRKRDVPEDEHMPVVIKNRTLYDRIWDAEARLMPDAKKVVHTLYDWGVSMGIGTTNRKMIVNKFIARFEFGATFKTIITSEDVQKRKPDPEVYLLAQQKMGVPKNRILIVEDTSVGVQAAKNAGMACAAIPGRYAFHQDFSEAQYLLEELGSILDYF